MVEWQSIETAPKDSMLILLYGLLEPHPEEKHLYGGLEKQTMVTGYWCSLDDAWAVHGGTWLGPWFKPSHWMPLPEGPKND